MIKTLKSQSKSYITNFLFIAAFYIAMMLLFNFGILNNYYKDIIILIFIYIILTVSLNLTVGFLGQLTLGHAGFMAIGAYVSALFTKTLSLPGAIEFPIAILLAGVSAALVGILIGIPALRLRGDYLAIITLGFGEIIRNIIINLDFIGGAKGYSSIPRYSNFTVIFWIAVFTVFFVFTLTRSRHGRAIISIRENEIAAEVCGIDTTYYKLLAFSVAAFFAGIAGALFAHHMSLLDPSKFDYNYSIEMVIMVVFGGMGSITGSIVSTALLTALPQVLSNFEKYRMLIYSIILIIIMIFKPSGLFGKYEFSLSRLLTKIRNKIKPKQKKGA